MQIADLSLREFVYGLVAILEVSTVRLAVLVLFILPLWVALGGIGCQVMVIVSNMQMRTPLRIKKEKKKKKKKNRKKERKEKKKRG